MLSQVSLNGYVDEPTKMTVIKPPTFTYYAGRVERIEPLGGPIAGDTMITLHGTNLADYGGALCKFIFGIGLAAGGAAGNSGTGEAAMVEVITSASLHSGNGVGLGAMRCAAPLVDASRLSALNNSLPSAASLDLSLNGDATQSVDATPCDASAMTGAGLLSDVASVAAANASQGRDRRARCYAFFDPSSVRLDDILPRGGTHYGGTLLTLLGAGFHAFGLIGCAIGSLDVAPASRISEHELRCRTPTNGPLPSTGRLPVQLTLNGIDALPPPSKPIAASAPSAGVAQLMYTYFNSRFIQPTVLVPDRGSARGATLVTVYGRGFHDFGGVLCKFGGEAATGVGAGIDGSTAAAAAASDTSSSAWVSIVNATLRADGTVVCESPPYDAVAYNASNASAPLASVPLRVLLNGLAESSFEGDAPMFTYEPDTPKDASARTRFVPELPLSVQRAKMWRKSTGEQGETEAAQPIEQRRERLMPMPVAAKFAEEGSGGAKVSGGRHAGEVRADPSRYVHAHETSE